MEVFVGARTVVTSPVRSVHVEPEGNLLGSF
jgi:hypothetical protein